MTKSLPDRWLSYKPVGTAIKDTKILPFKVPLKQSLCDNLEPKDRFTPRKLLEDFSNLKFIIDLTNTNRYYDKQEFTNAGVRYQKVMIPGQQVPALEHVEKFFQVLDVFMSDCSEGDLIGIHCTHGINRTGYLICRYLIQQLNWTVEDALNAFDTARGYSIEREAYVSGLREVLRGEKIKTENLKPLPETSVSRKRRFDELDPYPTESSSTCHRIPPKLPFQSPLPPRRFNFGPSHSKFNPIPPSKLRLPISQSTPPRLLPPPPPPPPPPLPPQLNRMHPGPPYRFERRLPLPPFRRRHTPAHVHGDQMNRLPPHHYRRNPRDSSPSFNNHRQGNRKRQHFREEVRNEDFTVDRYDENRSEKRRRRR